MTNEEIVKAYKKSPDNKYLVLLYDTNKAGLYKLCNKYKSYGDIEDYMQECYIALYEAIKNYDDTKGMSFFSYWYLWAKALIIKYISLEAGYSVPEYIKSLELKYKKYVNAYKIQYGTIPEDNLICFNLKISQEMLESIRLSIHLQKVKSIDEKISDEEETTLAETLQDKKDDIESCIDRIAEEELIDKLWQTVESLGNEASEIIKLKYIDEMPLKEIAQKLGINKNSINSLCNKYYNKLRLKQVIKTYAEDIYSLSVKPRGTKAFYNTMTSQTELVALYELGAGTYHERQDRENNTNKI